MLELTGVAGVLRGISILYWLVAVVALAVVLWKGRRWWWKSIGALAVVGVFGFLPATQLIEARTREGYAREAWAHFKNQCEEKAGQRIYKSFAGVKSVHVVKPLPPASEKDLYDQHWYGDPYSAPAHSRRGIAEAAALIGTLELRGLKPRTAADRLGYEFVESVATDSKDSSVRFNRYSYPSGVAGPLAKEDILSPVSRFGISWEDISTSENRKYWVAGSRLRVIDLTDNSVVAERIGFMIEAGFGSQVGGRRPWLTSRGPNTTCPKLESLQYQDRFFIQRVLDPSKDREHGK